MNYIIKTTTVARNKYNVDWKMFYLEGRPQAHHLHRELALSVGASPIHVDSFYRWQDLQLPILMKLIAWFSNSFILVNKGDFQFILVDNLHVSPVIMRKLGLIKKSQKIICHLGSHTLFFTMTKKFSKWTNYLHKFLLENYDALICEGQMAVDITKRIVPDQKVYYSFLGLKKDQIVRLSQIQPDLNSTRILFIGNIESDFRYDYKGIDLILKAIKVFNGTSREKLTIDIIGKWSEDQMVKAKDILPCQINFLGYQDFYPQLHKYQIYLHCSRGDAFPTTSLEAMTAGLLTIVSDWTGTKEIVEKVNKRLVTDLDPMSISATLGYLLSLNSNEKKRLSDRFRKIAQSYTFEKAVINYQRIFRDLSN